MLILEISMQYYPMYLFNTYEEYKILLRIQCEATATRPQAININAEITA